MSDVSTLPVHKWNFRQPGREAGQLIICPLQSCTFIVDEDRENALDTEGLDLIIVPGLGFTEVSCSSDIIIVVYILQKLKSIALKYIFRMASVLDKGRYTMSVLVVDMIC
jgi:hypothetical protein